MDVEAELVYADILRTLQTSILNPDPAVSFTIEHSYKLSNLAPDRMIEKFKFRKTKLCNSVPPELLPNFTKPHRLWLINAATPEPLAIPCGGCSRQDSPFVLNPPSGIFTIGHPHF